MCSDLFAVWGKQPVNSVGPVCMPDLLMLSRHHEMHHKTSHCGQAYMHSNAALTIQQALAKGLMYPSLSVSACVAVKIKHPCIGLLSL